MNGGYVPAGDVIGIVIGCTALGLAVLRLDGWAKDRLVVRRRRRPWPAREPARHTNVVVLPRQDAPYDWAQDTVTNKWCRRG
jgi:hypothetical protein